MTDKNRRKLSVLWIIVAIVAVVAGFWAVTQHRLTPPQAGPYAQPTAILPGAVTNFNALQIKTDIVAGRYITAATVFGNMAAGTFTGMSGTYLTATNATVTNGTFTGLSGTYLTPTNATITAGTFTGLSGTYLTPTNATITAGTFTGLSGTYLTSTNASLTNETVTAGTFTGLSSTYLTSTNVISMSGATFTGPVKYGTAATYTKDAAITHGFATTPTICMLWPAEITATLTITTTAFSSNTANHANPIYWMCGQ